MTEFSANLGFLWTELALPDAIRAARKAGFHAVECHFPYATTVADAKAALTETGLPMLGLNTRKGDPDKGENGLCALPGRMDEARAAIDEAIAYATAITCGAVHVMAGVTTGAQAEKTFADNLAYACAQAAPHGITILIEPLNRDDAPGYFLTSTGQAVGLIEQVGALNLKLMFDCYHVQRTEGDLTHRLTELMPHIGHIQIAGAPARGRPDIGEINYPHLYAHLKSLGYTKPLGAEYKTFGPTEPTLGWLRP